ncbi:hypothetical protein [Leeuwenhoekiella sp. MAR_2009_132]|uniref:hypothetical protein n=1 Tax=Leeuwenhoekiella sp. MAR_2009_132 TaxID=1392489 RepID=UPI00048DDD73|nr:hypothetical protein [Leeuwenhoekiella sp. MAR_2009_132]
MQRISLFSIFILNTMLLMSCGATPGLTNLTQNVDANLPVYTYLDTEGNTYRISPNKLIYDPASAENTIDGIKDQGYHLELNISLNDYSKIAATCKKQFEISQEALPAANTDFVIPQLTRKSTEINETIDLGKTAVQDLNYVIKPFLKDE